MPEFAPETLRFEIGGVAVSCTTCAHDRFRQRTAQLNTTFATMFWLDWANRSATCLVCDNGGYILSFLPE